MEWTGVVDDIQRRNRETLDAIQVRRDAFYEATLTFEAALAAPAGDRPADWAAALGGPIAELHDVLEAHITATEGPDGLFAEIRDEAPRLIHATERLAAEHDPLRQATAALAEQARSVSDADGVEAVREAGLDLIHRLLLHRHRGAELVYDAQWLDVPAGD
jgi:hypothetical protein